MIRRDVLSVELGRAGAAIRALVETDGVVGASRALGGLAYDHARYPLVRRRRAHEHFSFREHRLPYTIARYNSTFRNERSVEISIARWFLDQVPGGKVLEVGNVLAHYGLRGHDVVDRYETVRGVVNDDILDFVPAEQYDTVVSISTLEHVGQDEEPRAPERAVAAFERLDALARPDGRVLVTIPVGYNETLDDALRNRRVRMPVESVLARVDRANHWLETGLEDGLSRRYGDPYANANAVYVGMRGA